jgi:hypothetical protein
MKKKKLIWILGLLHFTLVLVAQPGLDFSCGTGSNPVVPEAEMLPQNCNTNFDYFLANHADDMVPQGIDRKLKIRTNIVFVQNENGEGNFSITNFDHMDYWERIFAEVNGRLEQLMQENCSCQTTPTHYGNIHVEFVPNYVEVRDNFAWDHNNDPDPNAGTASVNSYNKSYLNYIHALAEQAPGYQLGFDLIITTDGPAYNTYVYNNPDNKPLWELGYTSFYGGYWYSAFPSYDLNHPAMWHAPDAYLRYINGLDHLGGLWWLHTQDVPWMAGTLLHEYGHYFNLKHPAPHLSCPNNIMRPGGSNTTRLAFTGCQVREMYQTLMTKNLRKYVQCEDVLSFDLVVDNNETWAMNLKVLGNVRIKNGATLTLTCEVHMGPKSRIIVERGGQLIVDGGLITSGCPGEWGVIRVEGDVPGQQAQSGKVVLKNGAIIEYARTAISMNPYHLPWDNGGLQNYYGGVVEVENSTIRNCVRAVEFMKYGQSGLKDNSWFNNVTFENLYEGVTLWANDGVTFDNCTFKNISTRSIHPYDCEVVVRESNTFNQSNIGVDVITTYPIIFASKIGKTGFGSNTFNCQDAGVYIQSAGNVEPLRVFNNIFSDGNNGIHQNGNGLLYVENNRFSGHLTSVELHSGGTGFNHIKGNEIQSSYLGAHSVKQNSGLRYRDNCFSANQLVDIFVSDGDIFPAQGEDGGVAAGNCFTKNGKPEIDNDAGTGPVFYYITAVTPNSSCKYPVNLKSVTLETTANIDDFLACGPSGLIGSENEYYCDFDESLSITSLQQQRLLMMQELATLSSGSSIVAVKTLERCIKILESLIGQKMLDPESEDLGAGKENAIAFYTSVGMDFKDKTTAYGIMVHYGELSRARTFLNSLVPQTREESDFVAVQHINLDYLGDTRHYVLSETTNNYLYSVGTLDGPFDGYARSLYEVLTSERIEVEIPEVGTEERSVSLSSDVASMDMQVYPNPSGDGIFNLSIEGLPQGNAHSTTPTDAFGRLVHKFNVSSDGVYSISSERLSPGMYFLIVRDEFGYTLFSSKLVVSN